MLEITNTTFSGDVPFPRFGHSITFYDEHKLCLFGGALGSAIKMILTDTAYSLDMLTSQWSKIQVTGLVPSARAAHGAVSTEKNRIVIYGGATQHGVASDELYLLDIKEGLGIWNIVNVRHKTPGKRYGHTLSFNCPYLIVFGGNIDNKTSNDLWILDIQQKPLEWIQVKCKGKIPRPRDYHTASVCNYDKSSGLIVIFGGRSDKKDAMSDCWGLTKHKTGSKQWDWIQAPGKPKFGRYQHTSVFVKNLMVVIGGKTDRQQKNCIQIFNIEKNIWETSIQIQQFRHASWCYKNNMFLNGGFSINSLEASEQTLSFSIEKFLKLQDNSPGKNILVERERAKIVGQSRSNSTQNSRCPSISSKQQKNLSRDEQNQKQGNLSKLRQRQKLKLLPPLEIDTKKIIKSVSSKEALAIYFLNRLLRPSQFSLSFSDVSFKKQEIISLCDLVEQIIANQSMLLHVRAPVKIFGDIHGQYSNLMEFFHLYGSPHIKSEKKDIENFDYIFLGDYVDRGKFSLETICLLFALKVLYPQRVHLLRGNHQDNAVNIDHGFQEQCQEKIQENPLLYDSVFMRINRVFEWLPLAAIVEQKILCVHGGIGKKLQKVEQIIQIKRPLQILHEAIDNQSQIVLDILWSDPTQSDQILGVHPNDSRDPRRLGDIVRYGPDRVKSFLENNNLSMIIRAHECVMDGFQRFADGKLITVFSATDYCERHKNAGGMLVIKTNLEIVPKIIYPKSKNTNTWLQEVENCPKRAITPPRWKKFY